MREKTAGERYLDLVELELNQERASVLGRFGRRVEQAIAKCETLLETLDSRDDRAVEEYRAARASALQAVADLCLQREVIGLTDHRWVERHYRVPPPASSLVDAAGRQPKPAPPKASSRRTWPRTSPVARDGGAT
jgi:hypothetical protein